MNSKERVLTSLNHKQTDKVAVDFGAHTCSGMHVSCLKELREYFGIEGPVKCSDLFTMTGIFEDELRDAVGIDVIGVDFYKNMFGCRTNKFKEWDYFGQTLLVPEEFKVTDDGKGGYYTYAEGDDSAPPSAHMPKNGYYFDNIIRQSEIDEDNMDYRDNLEEFQLPTEDEIQFYRRQAAILRDCDRAVVMGTRNTSLGDIANVPAPFLKHPKGIRAIDEWYMAPYLYPEYIWDIFSHETEIALETLEILHDIMGDTVDVIYICGTDFGTQNSTFFPVEKFEELWMPHYKKINDWVHKNTNWKTMKHSCGAVFDYIPALIESGFDILNPVQCSAAGMDAKRLKSTFGKEMSFWGGGVDTQKILPFGTPQEIRAQVLERCEIFGRDGGFVFNAIHNVQHGTPLENILAMINAVREFNGDSKV